MSSAVAIADTFNTDAILMNFNAIINEFYKISKEEISLNQRIDYMVSNKDIAILKATIVYINMVSSHQPDNLTEFFCTDTIRASILYTIMANSYEKCYINKKLDPHGVSPWSVVANEGKSISKKYGYKTSLRWATVIMNSVNFILAQNCRGYYNLISSFKNDIKKCSESLIQNNEFLNFTKIKKINCSSTQEFIDWHDDIDLDATTTLELTEYDVKLFDVDDRIKDYEIVNDLSEVLHNYLSIKTNKIDNIYHSMFPQGSAGVHGGVDGSYSIGNIMKIVNILYEKFSKSNNIYGVDFGHGTGVTMLTILSALIFLKVTNITMVGIEGNDYRYYQSKKLQLKLISNSSLTLKKSAERANLLYCDKDTSKFIPFELIGNSISFIFCFSLGWDKKDLVKVFTYAYSHYDNLSMILTDVPDISKLGYKRDKIIKQTKLPGSCKLKGGKSSRVCYIYELKETSSSSSIALSGSFNKTNIELLKNEVSNLEILQGNQKQKRSLNTVVNRYTDTSKTSTKVVKRAVSSDFRIDCKSAEVMERVLEFMKVSRTSEPVKKKQKKMESSTVLIAVEVLKKEAMEALKKSHKKSFSCEDFIQILNNLATRESTNGKKVNYNEY